MEWEYIYNQTEKFTTDNTFKCAKLFEGIDAITECDSVQTHRLIIKINPWAVTTNGYEVLRDRWILYMECDFTIKTSKLYIKEG